MGCSVLTAVSCATATDDGPIDWLVRAERLAVSTRTFGADVTGLPAGLRRPLTYAAAFRSTRYVHVDNEMSNPGDAPDRAVFVFSDCWRLVTLSVVCRLGPSALQRGLVLMILPRCGGYGRSTQYQYPSPGCHRHRMRRAIGRLGLSRRRPRAWLAFRLGRARGALSGRRTFAEPFSAAVLGARLRYRAGCERDERSCQRQGGELHQEKDVVVAGGLVQAQAAAVGAAVDEHPARLSADRDRDRLHLAGAVRFPVAGNVAV